MSPTVTAGDQLQTVRLFSNDYYDLTKRMMILEDPSNLLTIDQVSSNDYLGKFVKNDDDILNISISSSTYWIKFSLIYPDAYPNKEDVKQWYLEVGNPLLDIAELFVPEFDGMYRVESSDARSELSGRSVVHVNSIFPLELQLGQEFTFYVRIKNTTSIRVPLHLWTPEGLVKNVAVEEFAYGLFYGCMSILLIYNIFLYLSVRDVSYLYYVLYLAGITMFELLELGHGLVHIERYFGTVNREWILLFIWQIAMSGVLFAISFMDMKRNYKKIYALFKMLLAISVVSFLLTLSQDYAVGADWGSMFNTTFMPTYLGVIFYTLMTGNKNARYFFVAWIFNILGLLIFSAVTSKIIPANSVTLVATPIGILLESIVFSLALANRIKINQIDAIEADKRALGYLAQYQSAFDNAFAGMYKMTPSGQIVSANKAMAKTFGLSGVDELLMYGRSIVNVVFDDPERQFSALLECGVVKNNLCFFRRDGKKIWAIHSAKIIFDVSGEISHIEGSVENITQIKLKEIAVIENEKEIVENRIAEASTQAKSEFLANMNHEIRTPLAAIIGFSESLKDDQLSKEEKNNTVKLVVESSQALLQLISDILDFSKIEANKLAVEEVPVNVPGVVSDLNREFSAKAEAKGLRFDVVYRYPIPSIVIGDPTRMAQVMSNLCANAIKFTEEGSVVLVVSWQAERNRLKFEVIDSGLGISEKDQGTLFHVFEQADTSSTREYGGAGLGLAISKKLALMMGGDIKFLSESGKGSVFTFNVAARIPQDAIWIRRDELSDLTQPSQDLSSLKQAIPILTGTILLAEDNVVNQKLIEKVLSKTGVEVVIAADGVEACNICESRTLDFVLMDINMPNQDGLSATRYLRNNGFDLPIFALTAEAESAEINKAVSAGCDGFLAKPLNKALLYKALSEHLPHSKSTN